MSFQPGNWIVDPSLDQVEVYRWTEEPRVLKAGDVLVTDLLPGLELDVETLAAGGR